MEQTVQIMLEDLGRQVAEKSVQLAEWKARAIVAELTLAGLEEAAAAEETDDLYGVDGTP